MFVTLEKGSIHTYIQKYRYVPQSSNLRYLWLWSTRGLSVFRRLSALPATMRPSWVRRSVSDNNLIVSSQIVIGVGRFSYPPSVRSNIAEDDDDDDGDDDDDDDDCFSVVDTIYEKGYVRFLIETSANMKLYQSLPRRR